MSKTAQQYAEALGERIRKASSNHDVTVKPRETEFGTFWYVAAHGRTVLDRSLIGVSWLQRKPGRPGPQVRFYGGLADGYGVNRGKVVNISKRSELEMWM